RQGVAHQQGYRLGQYRGPQPLQQRCPRVALRSGVRHPSRRLPGLPARRRHRVLPGQAGVTSTRPLKVGFQLPEVERQVRWPEIAAMARRGEQVGFDSVWLGDHLLYRDEAHGARGPWEAWTMLAGIAASTSRIAIGPLVACTSFHNPAMLRSEEHTSELQS